MLYSGLFTVSAVLFAILSSSLVVECQQRIALTPQMRRDLDEVGQNIEDFSLTLVLRSIIDGNYTNVNISPFSVWAMLTVLSEGAAGETYSELAKVLRNHNPEQLRSVFPIIKNYFLIKTPTVQLETANAIFTDTKTIIRPEYGNLVRNVYDTQLFPTDFLNPRTLGQINGYINNITNGKIPEIVNADDLRNAQLICTNAIYFKGQWTMPFNISETKREAFYNENANPVGQVNMMYQRGPFPYANMKQIKAHVLELPYGKARPRNNIDDFDRTNQGEEDEENRVSMIVILPHRGVSLSNVVNVFQQVSVKEIFKTLTKAAEEYEDDEVDVYLPRLSITTDLVLNRMLERMGIFQIFDPSYAKLTKLTQRDDLYLSSVIHKATLEVTEEGTVASAVTAGELTNRISPPKFVANKPFMYLIAERPTNIILFGGAYTAPGIY